MARTGKIDTGTIITIGAGVALLFGMKTISSILEELGVIKSKDGKDYDNNINNPYSFWNPLFWQQGGPGTLLITAAHCQWLYSEIYNSFGIFNDDEARIYAAFKTLKTQSQLSYFSWWIQQNKNLDLLKWLKGGNWGPIGDHLSVAEIAVITDYFKRLPKYKV